ncbi:MAG: glycosyltransferase, partial [Planctomycetales bacterium]|nr:glycosyltransferase [Planctomycetales bacterium]
MVRVCRLDDFSVVSCAPLDQRSSCIDRSIRGPNGVDCHRNDCGGWNQGLSLCKQEGAGRQLVNLLRNDTLSVIVPTFNEANTIGTVVERLLKLEILLEIIVVDDGSTD